MEGKVPNGKDRASAKKTKGTSGGKAGESGKAASGSGNDGASQRLIKLKFIGDFSLRNAYTFNSCDIDLYAN